MGNIDVKYDQRAAVDLTTQSEAGLQSAIPMVMRPKTRPLAALHLACEGDNGEADSLDITANSLPLFDTHGSRHLG